jgi:hypothetical protein
VKIRAASTTTGRKRKKTIQTIRRLLRMSSSPEAINAALLLGCMFCSVSRTSQDTQPHFASEARKGSEVQIKGDESHRAVGESSCGEPEIPQVDSESSSAGIWGMFHEKQPLAVKNQGSAVESYLKKIGNLNIAVEFDSSAVKKIAIRSKS